MSRDHKPYHNYTGKSGKTALPLASHATIWQQPSPIWQTKVGRSRGASYISQAIEYSFQPRVTSGTKWMHFVAGALMAHLLQNAPPSVFPQPRQLNPRTPAVFPSLEFRLKNLGLGFLGILL